MDSAVSAAGPGESVPQPSPVADAMDSAVSAAGPGESVPQPSPAADAMDSATAAGPGESVPQEQEAEVKDPLAFTPEMRRLGKIEFQGWYRRGEQKNSNPDDPGYNIHRAHMKKQQAVKKVILDARKKRVEFERIQFKERQELQRALDRFWFGDELNTWIQNPWRIKQSKQLKKDQRVGGHISQGRQLAQQRRSARANRDVMHGNSGRLSMTFPFFVLCYLPFFVLCYLCMSDSLLLLGCTALCEMLTHEVRYVLHVSKYQIKKRFDCLRQMMKYCDQGYGRPRSQRIPWSQRRQSAKANGGDQHGNGWENERYKIAFNLLVCLTFSLLLLNWFDPEMPGLFRRTSPEPTWARLPGHSFESLLMETIVSVFLFVLTESAVAMLIVTGKVLFKRCFFVSKDTDSSVDCRDDVSQAPESPNVLVSTGIHGGFEIKKAHFIVQDRIRVILHFIRETTSITMVLDVTVQSTCKDIELLLSIPNQTKMITCFTFKGQFISPNSSLAELGVRYGDELNFICLQRGGAKGAKGRFKEFDGPFRVFLNSIDENLGSEFYQFPMNVRGTMFHSFLTQDEFGSSDVLNRERAQKLSTFLSGVIKMYKESSPQIDFEQWFSTQHQGLDKWHGFQWPKVELEVIETVARGLSPEPQHESHNSRALKRQHVPSGTTPQKDLKALKLVSDTFDPKVSTLPTRGHTSDQLVQSSSELQFCRSKEEIQKRKASTSGNSPNVLKRRGIGGDSLEDVCTVSERRIPKNIDEVLRSATTLNFFKSLHRNDRRDVYSIFASENNLEDVSNLCESHAQDFKIWVSDRFKEFAKINNLTSTGEDVDKDAQQQFFRSLKRQDVHEEAPLNVTRDHAKRSLFRASTSLGSAASSPNTSHRSMEETSGTGQEGVQPATNVSAVWSASGAADAPAVAAGLLEAAAAVGGGWGALWRTRTKSSGEKVPPQR
jgi:hypothetical protein